MKIPFQESITSQNVRNSFEKGIYMDTPANRKKGVVGQQYDIPSEEKVKKTEFKKLEVHSEELGKKAFHAGAKLNAGEDKELLKKIKDLTSEQKTVMFKAWARGYQAELADTAFKEASKKDWKGDRVSWR